MLLSAACVRVSAPALLLPHDKPQEAEDFERQQRLAWAGAVDARSKYREALEWSARAEERISAAKHGPRAFWQELGPGNIGGRVRTLAIHPDTPDRMLLASVSGGPWRSDDGGLNWRSTGDELANLTINSMALDPSNPSIVYVGTGEGYFREEVRGTDLPLRGGGMYVSSDFGDHWKYLPATASSDFYWVNDLAISSIDSKRLYAATRTGVWRSSDAGASWRRILPTDVKGGCLDLALHSAGADDYLFASCGTFAQATVYLNANAADDTSAWESVLSEPGMGRTSIAIAPSAPQIVYALSARNAPDDEQADQAVLAVFRSDRGGRAGSWTAVATGGGANIESVMLSAAAGGICMGIKPPRPINMGWYTNVIAVDPVDPARVWVGGVSLYRSDDGGASWGLAGSGPSLHVDQHNIIFSPGYNGASGRTLFVTNDGGIYKTSDATSGVVKFQQACAGAQPQVRWSSLNNSLGVTQLYHGTIIGNTGTVLAGSQDNGVLRYKATAGANGWKWVGGGDGGYTAVDPQKLSVIFAMTAFGILLKSTTGGELFNFVPSPQDELPFITPMILDPRPASTLWIAGSQVWRSIDEGRTWVAATSRLGEGVATALAVSPHDREQLFVGTSSGAIYRTNSARQARGEAWEFALPRRGFVSSIHADSLVAHSLFATYSGFGAAHIWHSADGGASWSDIDGVGEGRLPDIPVHALVVDPQSTDLYIATDIGVYHSSDAGLSWSRAGEGMPWVVTKWLAIGPNPAGTLELVAFTHGRGAWSMPLGGSGRRRAVRR